MGGAMVRCLLEAGHPVTVYDSSPEAVRRAVDLGAIAASSPKSVAEASEVVIASLPGPAEVESVLLHSSEGILAGLAPGGVFIDTTTNSPAAIRKFATVCRRRSVDILDAPVTGRPPNMTIMAGGDQPVFIKYRPLLEDMAARVFYMGGIGQGMVAKAAHQLIGFATFFGTVEALLLGTKAGLDLATFVEMYTSHHGEGSQWARLAPVFKGEFTGYPIAMAVKDADMACEVAASTGVRAPMAHLLSEILENAKNEGWGDQPFGNIVRALEQQAGVELRLAASEA
jgi:3-hydroxyisobutyrate dehydrogenase-like beta-hydroxyacid dehydrogenase